MASASPLVDYSQEKMVLAISSFYAFLKGMHSETGGMGDFEYPPPGGWPHVTKDLFPHYTARVVELIRNLPYYDDESFLVMPDTSLLPLGAPSMCTALAQNLQRTIVGGDGDMPAKEENDDEETGTRFPAYIFALAAGGQYGSSILVDTKYNAVIWWKYDGTYLDLPEELTSKYSHLGCFADYSKNQADDDGEQSEIDQYGPDAWKIMSAWPPEDFFEMCKDQFRILNWLPVLDESCRGKVIEVHKHQEWEGTALKLKNIMLHAGWPGDGQGGGWDKAGAEAAMERLREEEDDEENAIRLGIARDTSLQEKWRGMILQHTD